MASQCGFAALCVALAVVVFAQEPNPPNWGAQVQVFSPGDDPTVIQAAIDDSWHKNGGQVATGEPTSRYSPYRFAFMFKPGTYEVDAPMGYYVHVLGIGAIPDEVVFEKSTGPHVPCNNQLPQPGQLVTFWRMAERFKRVGDLDWFVSQAAPLRDLHITGDLNLHKAGSHGSGGYTANTHIEGNMHGGDQQQWFTRNCYIGGDFTGIAYNAVFVGVVSQGNAPYLLGSSCQRNGSSHQYVVVPETPLIAEKPFISVDPNDDSKFNLNVPEAKTNSVGPYWSTSGTVIPFEHVYVTSAHDTASIINAKLQAGRHVVISPGIYILNEPLRVVHDDQVLLCLGLSTLLAARGNAAIEVAAGIGGVRIGGCILEAGVVTSRTLFQWGKQGEASSGKPSYIYDIFTRIGGPSFQGYKGNAASANISVQIDADDVVADHLWLWRGDHYLNEEESTDASDPDEIGITKLGELHNANGLVVTGDRVRVYNLAVEHAVEDQVVWSGEDGEVYFFQCELPYDVNAAWSGAGYVSYRVTENVQRHTAYGIGAYAYFNAFSAFMETAFRVPQAVLPTIYYPFIVKLWEADSAMNEGGSGIKAVINGQGPGAGWPDTTVRHTMALMCAWNSDDFHV